MKLKNIIHTLGLASLVVAAPNYNVKRAGGFQFFGVSESGAEFGQGNIPGREGTDYTWPSPSAIQTLRNAGMNIFRVPFFMERLVPNSMTGTPDATYLASLKSTVNTITSSGAYAIVDPHNFGRYYNNIITSTSDFAAFWKTLASQFASNPNVIFDTNNEFNNEPQDTVYALNQAAINAIRAAGATTQYIFVEGNSYSGAWTWTQVNDGLKSLTDPSNKIVYEMHQYLDNDGSGTSDQCVSSTVGQERVQSATQWLIANKKIGFLGEFAGGANTNCQTAIKGMLDYMSQNTNVWLGATWWSAGPWWGNYMFSFEPPSGTAYTYYLSLLKNYFPGSSGNPVTTTSSSKLATTTAASGMMTTTTTTPARSTTISSSPAKTTTSSAVAISSTTTVPPSKTSTSSSATQTLYGQCGGMNWAGPTVCQSPYTCQYNNPYYSQCLPAQSAAPASTTGITSPSPSPSSTSIPPSKTQTTASATQTLYGQCGGINWTGPTQCQDPFTCQYNNPYYSQCLPAQSKTSPDPAIQTHYGQCGGTNWTGPTKCETPYTCQYNNAYYSQCL